ncbi:alpha/beta hydrolase family protein [Robertkochia sediminum]|uniref:alpha/beta hydrolase family protein n=1 Tax=Robertkochia sediminum TaxID=2785326 RepID=UPI0019341FA9|nr:alpha/beta fold hydrolase [Robertkochia sediminum]MBL7472595.1 alpha/beta fold hydrolase [Robertkochia sediminum]
MKLHFTCVLLISWFAASAQSPSHTWKGTLNFSGRSLQLHFELPVPNDSSATLSVPAQGLVRYPASNTTISKDSIRLHFDALGIEVNGAFTNDSIINARFLQNNMSFPLTLNKSTDARLLLRPQNPKPPFPYISRDVSFTNKEANITLKGTFSVPHGNTPFPAVVLISGSGPQDRDATIAGHQWFAVLADQLTRAGIAVLRYDDRGIGASEGNFDQATTTDFATDAHAALAWLKEQPETATGHVGYAGHSEGGLVALIAANHIEKPDFLILLATPVTQGNEFMLEQKRDVETAMGIPEPAVTASNQLFRKLYTTLMNMDGDREERKTTIIKELEELTKNALSASQSAQLANTLSTDWMTALLKTKPEYYITGLSMPVLALYGSKDIQVNAKTHSTKLCSLLPEKIKAHSQVKNLEGLNHLFQPATTGLPEEYATITTTLSPDIVHFIEKWVAKR